VSGVKGLSLLYSIPKFNIVTGVLPEIMQAIYFGVCRQFESLWFTNVSAPYYIQNYGVFDSILMTACDFLESSLSMGRNGKPVNKDIFYSFIHA